MFRGNSFGKYMFRFITVTLSFCAVCDNGRWAINERFWRFFRIGLLTSHGCALVPSRPSWLCDGNNAYGYAVTRGCVTFRFVAARSRRRKPQCSTLGRDADAGHIFRVLNSLLVVDD